MEEEQKLERLEQELHETIRKFEEVKVNKWPDDKTGTPPTTDPNQAEGAAPK